jgi:hypothetical protein
MAVTEKEGRMAPLLPPPDQDEEPEDILLREVRKRLPNGPDAVKDRKKLLEDLESTRKRLK